MLRIHFNSPDGLTEFMRDATAPAVDSPNIIQDFGTFTNLPANTYAFYKNVLTDFTEAGEWKLCLEYQDATGAIYFGDTGILTIGIAC